MFITYLFIKFYTLSNGLCNLVINVKFSLKSKKKRLKIENFENYYCSINQFENNTYFILAPPTRNTVRYKYLYIKINLNPSFSIPK